MMQFTLAMSQRLITSMYPKDQDIEIPYDLIQVKVQFQIDNEETNRNTT